MPMSDILRSIPVAGSVPSPCPGSSVIVERHGAPTATPPCGACRPRVCAAGARLRDRRLQLSRYQLGNDVRRRRRPDRSHCAPAARRRPRLARPTATSPSPRAAASRGRWPGAAEDASAAVGKPEHRRARHRDADGRRLCQEDGATCRDFLASYVGDGSRSLAAGRGLPGRQAGSGRCGSLQPGISS